MTTIKKYLGCCHWQTEDRRIVERIVSVGYSASEAWARGRGQVTHVRQQTDSEARQDFDDALDEAYAEEKAAERQEMNMARRPCDICRGSGCYICSAMSLTLKPN